MSIIDAVQMSFTSLKRNKVRTFLTSFAVFIGVFIIIFLVSLSFGAQKLLISQITNQFDIRSIFVLKKGALNFNILTTKVKQDDAAPPKILDKEALDEIKAIDGVEFADPIVSISAKKLEFKDKTFDDRSDSAAAGAGWNLREGDQLVTKILGGQYTNLQEGEIVLTESLLNAYGKTADEVIGQTVVITDQSNILGGQSKPLPPKEYTVVGAIGDIRNFTYIISTDSALADNAKKNGYKNVDEYVQSAGYPSLYVKAQTETQVKDVSAAIQKLGFDSSSLEDILNLFNTFFNIIPIIFTIVGAIAVFVASIGIINTMVMSVFERTKEIGVMKAVGAKNGDIRILFITESGLIGFIGGVVAVLTSLGVIALVEAVVVKKVLPNLGITNITSLFETPVWLIVVTVVVSTIIGILAGLYPAIRASRLDPVTALRYE